MATDATGTPSTNFAFPKYDPDNDAPSGLGGNAIVDDIDSKLKTKVPNHLITSLATNDVPVWNGTTWVRPSGTASASTFLRGDGSWASAGSAITVGTSLPGSPSDGDRYILVDSTTAPTYAWLLQYSAGISDANKWLYVGGSPQAGYNGSSSSTTSTSFVDPTNNVSLVIARAGVYTIRATAELRKNGSTDAASNSACLNIAGSDVVDTEGQVYAQEKVIYGTWSVQYQTSSLSASTTVKARHRTGNGANTCHIENIAITITPVRVI